MNEKKKCIQQANKRSSASFLTGSNDTNNECLKSLRKQFPHKMRMHIFKMIYSIVSFLSMRIKYNESLVFRTYALKQLSDHFAF